MDLVSPEDLVWSLNALVSSSPIPPSTDQICDENKKNSSSQGTPNNNRNYVTKTKKILLFYVGTNKESGSTRFAELNYERGWQIMLVIKSDLGVGNFFFFLNVATDITPMNVMAD